MVGDAVVSLVILLGFLIMGVPLPLCFGGGLMYMGLVGGVNMKGMMVWGLQQILSPVLLSVPLFIFAGSLMGESGIAKSLLDFLDVFIGKVRGGLGHAAVIVCAIIGAVSGSVFTGVAATGPILISRMAEKGYPRGYATALVTSSSVLGTLIPPSVMMVIYGWVTETSILACFLSSVVPGLMVAFLMCMLNKRSCKKFPLILDEPLTWPEKRRQIFIKGGKALPALVMPVIILGGIYGGIMTPTEAAAVAAVYSIPIGFFVYRGLTLQKYQTVAKNASVAIGGILFMMLICLMLSQAYLMLRLPHLIVEKVFSYTQNKYVVLLLVNVVLIFLGMVVNDITAIILVAPLLLPLVKAVGVSPVHFAAICCVNLGFGSLTPPYASLLYLGMRIGKVEFTEILKPTIMFILFAYIPVLILTTYLPFLALFLPRLLGYV